MGSRVAAPRVMTLAAVAGLHAGALLWLLTETRTQRILTEPEGAPILAVLLRALEPRSSAEEPRRAHSTRARAAVSPAVHPPPTSTAISDSPSVSIDWAAEASSAADRVVEDQEKSRRQAHAFAPAPNGMFARPRAGPREFAWQPNKVEIVQGIATVIRLGDRCGLVLFVIVPVAGGCSLDKLPARGDLFDHMHEHD
ncbi:MAG TPA: hypothetical protein VET46_04125 [Steroidobacteraceae bacterium]|nr:hypothetical protein [Steroidobacteraceae bacterium]